MVCACVSLCVQYFICVCVMLSAIQLPVISGFDVVVVMTPGGICIYYGSPLVPAKAAATLPGVYYGSPLVPAKAAATLPGGLQN